MISRSAEARISWFAAHGVRFRDGGKPADGAVALVVGVGLLRAVVEGNERHAVQHVIRVARELALGVGLRQEVAGGVVDIGGDAGVRARLLRQVAEVVDGVCNRPLGSLEITPIGRPNVAAVEEYAGAKPRREKRGRGPEPLDQRVRMPKSRCLRRLSVRVGLVEREEFFVIGLLAA